METQLENENLSEEEKLKRVKAAKGGSWYSDHWTPYCMACKKMPRMDKRDYGFQCPNCRNVIGFNLTRLKESPLNVITIDLSTITSENQASKVNAVNELPPVKISDNP